MENQTSQTNDLPVKKFVDSFLKFLPVVQWILMMVIGIAVFAIGFRDTQTTQAQEVREIRAEQTQIKQTMSDRKNERDKQFEDLRRSIITKEVFDERTNAILRSIDLLRQERQQDREYLEKLVTR